MQHKACPVLFRTCDGLRQVLAFKHPLAGKQFVKGTVEKGETPAEAAVRELEEESGISIQSGMVALGNATIGSCIWHFFTAHIDGAPDRWDHQTRDDYGHVFRFFWHPIAKDLNEDWHPHFHTALEVIRRSLPDR